MKKLFLLCVLLLTFLQSPKAQYGTISFQTFYDELSPYGTWTNYPEYGYVWIPNVGRDFKPYSTRGYWEYTEYGWTWMSDYYWGWAPFHYGRWVYNSYWGWMWVPGYEWAPAWVVWGTYGSNYCWAPLGYGIGISYGFGWWPPSSYWWSSVPCNHFYGHNWHHYQVSPPRTHRDIRVINDVYNDRSRGRQVTWSRGPQVREVENFNRTNIRPLPVASMNTPGNAQVTRNNVSMYRPTVETRPANTVRPANTTPINLVRPASKLPATDPDINFRPAPVTNRPTPVERPVTQPAPNPSTRPVSPNVPPVTRPAPRNGQEFPPVTRPSQRPIEPSQMPPVTRPTPQPRPEGPIYRPAPMPQPTRPMPAPAPMPSPPVSRPAPMPAPMPRPSPAPMPMPRPAPAPMPHPMPMPHR